MTPANERKAKERKAKRGAGLVRFEWWIPPEMIAPLKAYIQGNWDNVMDARGNAPAIKLIDEGGT